MLMRSRGVSKLAGPYHRATSSGSVQARHTRSRGASNTRVIRTSRLPAVTSLIAISFLAQMRIEPVHPSLPGLLAGLHPLDRVVERVGLHPARPPLRFPAAVDQARLLQNLQ